MWVRCFVQYYAPVLSWTLSSLSVALGKPEPGESWPAYVGRVRSFSRNSVVLITVRLRNGIVTPVLLFSILIFSKRHSSRLSSSRFLLRKELCNCHSHCPIQAHCCPKRRCLTGQSYNIFLQLSSAFWPRMGDPEDELARCGWRGWGIDYCSSSSHY